MSKPTNRRAYYQRLERAACHVVRAWETNQLAAKVRELAQTLQSKSPPLPRFDYENQAWIDEHGRYMRCGHPESMDCGCYGRQHAGEPA